MASNSRDETIAFRFEASGNEQLDAIGKSIADIANGSTEAAPKAQALLDEFAKLGQQSGAVDNFVALKAELSELGGTLDAAKARVVTLDTEFENAAVVTQKMWREYQTAESAVTSLTARQNQLTAQLASTGNSLRAAGIDTENLDAAQRNLAQSITATQERAVAMATAHRDSSAAAQAESVSIESLSEKYGLFGGIVQNVKALLTTFAGLFALEKAKTEIEDILATGDKFEKFGIDFANAFGGAKAGEEALAQVKALADEVPLSLDQVAAAAIKAKKEGLDPFDGSLQSLIDVNAKYGGSVETLNSLIDGLGKAYNRGSLTTRELVSLQQQGIPVAQILGQALGKTGDEIQDMAKKGEIGRESIRLLIEQLGQSAAGDASKQMGLLGSLATKVKDQWEEFLNLIGKSGAYDFVRDKLQTLNGALKQGIGDGSLKEKAQAIADAIVAVGSGAATAAKFVYDHAAAIYDAAKAYVIFRTALLALDLAGAAAKMLALATATREAGVAAEAAAAETGAFGKLGAAIGRIPKSIQIGFLAVGIETLLEQSAQLVDGLQKLRDVNKEIRDLDQDRANQLTVLASRAQDVAAKLSGFAKTQIADADQLATKNRAQSEDYISQLENATRYYNALRIQAEAIGNAQGVADATAHLKDLAVALDLAKKHSADLADQIAKTDQAVNTIVNRFDDLKTHGESAATAVKGAFEHLELNTPQGLKDAIDIVQQLSIRSRDAKEAVQTELGGALAKLNEADLRQFQQGVTEQLKEAKGDADALKLALGSPLQEELARLGLSAEQVGAKFTSTGQKIISTFSDIATNANATGAQIQLAFAKALSQAQTQGEVDALKEKLQAAFDAGRIGADQFAAGMEAAGRKLADVQVAAAKAGAELDGMGTAGTTAAQRISGALQDSVGKLEVQANQIASAVNDALAAGDKVGAASLTAKLKVVEQEIASLNGQIQQLTPSYNAAGAAAESFETKAEIASAAQGRAAQNAALLANDAAEAASKAQRDYTEWGDSADKAAVQLGHATANTQHANDGMAALSQGIGDARAQFASISDAAAKFYDTVLKGNFEIGHSDDGSGFDRVARAMQAALQATQDQIAANRTQLQGMLDAANKVGTESVEDFNKLGGAAKYTESQLETMIASIQAGTYQVGLLGQQDLAPLQAALTAAKARVDALKAASEAAQQQLADMGAQLQDDLDNANGNQEAVENRRYQTQLANLQGLAKTAGQLNSAQYQTDVANATALHALNMKNLETQAAAAKTAAQQAQPSGARGSISDANATNNSGSTSSGGSGAIDAKTNVTRGGATSLGTLNISHAITVSIPAGAGLKGLSDADIHAIAEHVVSTMGQELTGTVIRQIQRAQMNSI